jgi:hypothetical protein
MENIHRFLGCHHQTALHILCRLHCHFRLQRAITGAGADGPIVYAGAGDDYVYSRTLGGGGGALTYGGSGNDHICAGDCVVAI